MKKKMTALLLVLLAFSVVAIGVQIGSKNPTTVIEAESSGEIYYDSEINVSILDEPNMFPNLWGNYNATVAGKTFEGAVVSMNAGRIIIEEEATCTETGTVDRLPAAQSFECCLTTKFYLLGGYTYYGYYRTEFSAFKRIPQQTSLGPITLEVEGNDADVPLTGTLAEGMSVSADTTATLYLRNCTNGSKPYYETGQYQFYLIAIPN